MARNNQYKPIESTWHNPEQRRLASSAQTFEWMSVLTPDGAILEANQATLCLVDRTLEAITGALIWQVYPWMDCFEAQVQLQNAIATANHQESVSLQMVLGKTPQESLVFELSIKSVRDRQGNVTVLIVKGREIAPPPPTPSSTETPENREQERATALLQTTLAEVQHLQHQLDCFLQLSQELVVIASHDGYFRRVNPAAQKLLGYSTEELTALPFLSLVHPDDYHKTQAAIRQQVEEHLSVVQLENRYRAKDGSYKWLSWNSIFTDGFLYAVGRDITEQKDAEVALRESEARYQNLAQLLPVGIFHSDAQGATLYTNPRWSEISGLSAAESLGDGWVQNIHPEDRTQAFVSWQRLINEQIPLQNEFRIIRPDGEIVWCLAQAQAERGENDEIKGYIGSVTDISDRKRTEEEMRLLLQQYRFLADTMPQMVWTGTPDGFIDYYNQRWLDFTGMSLEENLGWGWTAIVHPEDLQRCIDCWNHSLATGTDYQIEYRFKGACHDRYRWHLGRAVPLRNDEGEIMRWFGTCTDIDDVKQVEAALKQSEQEYRELAQRTQLINQLANQIRQSLNLNSILQTVVTEIRSLLSVDQCVFSFCRSEFGSLVWDVVEEASSPDLPSLIGVYPLAEIDELHQKLRNLEIIQIDAVQALDNPLMRQFWSALGFQSVLNVPIQLRSGATGVVSCTHSAKIRPWQKEEVALVVAVCDQIAIAIHQAELYEQSRQAATEAMEKSQQLEQTLYQLQRTQSQLIQSEKMSSLGQLVAGVAHEINNPVNFIFGNLTHAQEYSQQLLGLIVLYQQHYPNPVEDIELEIEEIDLAFLVEDLPKLLDSMKIGAVRIREIVSSLRTFSRLDESDMKEVDIHEGIDSTLMILQNRTKAKVDRQAIRLVKEYGSLPLIECYPYQLNQVFMNLLTNAIDTLDERHVQLSESAIAQIPSTITITTAILNSDWISISIADNGLGIPQAVQQRLFDPFFTTKPIGKGTGLGLSISYQIVVEKHQGRLLCHSSPNRGTEFVIEIPIRQRSC
uniref:PAS domain S-box protein n=1 Tax=Desertifilum tharense IPPAS B-1220 TaxID=1781255 RepID=A0ACD5GZ93_9CYAN